AQQMQQLTAALDGYVRHTLTPAGEYQAGHVRIDNRSIVLDEQGRLCAAGSDLPVAGREQALLGSDNATLMTPLRVRQALQEFAAAAPPQLEQKGAEAVSVTALALRPADSLLARAAQDDGGCCLQLLLENDGEKVLLSRLQLPAAVKQLSWNSDGTALGFIMRNAETGRDEAHFVAVSGRTLKGISKESTVCPAITALQPLPDGRFAATTAAGQLYLYSLSGGSFSALSGPITLPQAASAQHMLVTADSRLLVADGAQLHLYQLSDSSCTHLASCALADEVAALALHDSSLAVAYRGATPALQTVTVTASGLVPGLAQAAASPFAVLAWDAEGAYLLAAAAAEPLAVLYGWNGYQLQLKGEYRAAAPLQTLMFNGAYILLGGDGIFTLLQLTEQPQQRYAQLMLRDFTALAQGFYLLPAAGCKVYLGGERVEGEYCLLWGDSSTFTLDAGSHALQLEAGGQGLYLALFSGGGWQVMPLYLPPAATEQVLSGAAVPRPVTPAAARQLLLQQGRRAATLVVAAADSANPQAADFVCSGTADHLVLAEAVAALPESGGRIVLLDGTFCFDTTDVPLETVGNYQVYHPLQINKPDVCICGMGNATRIMLKSGTMNDDSKAGHQLYMLTVNGTGFSLRDLRLDGNKAANASGEVIGLLLAAGAVASQVEHCLLTSCNFSACNAVTSRVLLQGNRFADNFYGIRLVGGQAVCSNNEFFGNSKVDCYSFQSELQAVGNHHEGGTTGYFMQQNNYDFVTGNYLLGYQIGVREEGSTDLVVMGNFIQKSRGNGDYSGGGYPAYVAQSCTGAVIMNYTDGTTPYISSNCTVTRNLTGKTSWNIS
ncbi:MAG: hypothetical protein IJF62_00805, partial [Firmicutes bacterium]|nr:hypothetical protein [Bacillota bacterium]